MIAGIGLDLIEIARIEKLRLRNGRFPKRILTERELRVYEQLADSRQTEFLAGRFAAKEAYAKARGTGIGEELSFQDIEITTDELGKPHIAAPAEPKAHLSITHTKEYAAAQVVLEK